MKFQTITYKKILLLLLFFLMISGCGGGGDIASIDNSQLTTQETPASKNATSSPDEGSNDTSNSNTNPPTADEFSKSQYKGLVFYKKILPSSAYRLEQLSDSEFNALSREQKLQVANKLLNSLFFAYPLAQLQEKIATGSFLSDIRLGLENETTNKAWLESHILDKEYFNQYENKSYVHPQVLTIFNRFYAAKKLDRYFLNNWIAYILTQTIMFTPAYELSTSHSPDISRVYNRIVNMLEINSGMRYITYVHMMSEDNWRRFRSPEDNGREMLEIFLLDKNDSHVPLAAKALQNWALNSDNDTLEVGLNQNRAPISLFETTIYNGDDFYRELVKSHQFTVGVTTRLVDFFFPNKTNTQKKSIVTKIVASSPETWQDILLQILFSKEYLLHNNRVQSAEETFFSLLRKLDYQTRLDFFYRFETKLDEMHQASMKYKLGKLKRVPLDTLSFTSYHKYIRENILMQHANPTETDRSAWSFAGWTDRLINEDAPDFDSNDDVKTLHDFVNYLFNAIISRDADESEQALFKSHMIEQKNGKELFKDEFNIFKTYDDPATQERNQHYRRVNIALIVLDYLSRISETYSQKEVK